jgi:predicted kinase
MSEGTVQQQSSSTDRCPALIIMVGAPGSGKSYLGRALSEALEALLIQTDAVRKELYPDPSYTSAEAATVYGVCHKRIAEALAEGACVVFDGTNLSERHRRTLYTLGERAKATTVVVVAYASEATIRARLRHRAESRDPDDQSDADWPVYLRLRRENEPIPRPHIVVNTEAGPGPVVRLLQRRLSRSSEAVD